MFPAAFGGELGFEGMGVPRRCLEKRLAEGEEVGDKGHRHRRVEALHDRGRWWQNESWTEWH